MLQAVKKFVSEARALIVGRGHPRDPVLAELFGGAPTASGVVVNEETALTYSAVYAAIRIISETIASLPFEVFLRTDDGKEKVRRHPVYRLLHDSPNPEMTAMVAREAVQAQMLAWGNGYFEIERTNGGDVKYLWPLMSRDTRPMRDENGVLFYMNKNTPLPARDVLHIPAFGFDGICGKSPIRLMANSIGLGMAAERFGEKWFGNGSRPSGYIKHPGQLSEGAGRRMVDSWERAHGGIENSHRVALLEEGSEWKQVSIPPEDAQFLETRTFQVAEIARMYRLPPHMLAELSRATFSNIEELAIEFVTYTLTPWLVRWEQEVNRKIFGDDEQFFSEHNVDGLQRGNIESRFEAYVKSFTNGWASINEIRARENLNRIENGDEHFVPLNMVKLSEAGQEVVDDEPVEERNIGEIIENAISANKVPDVSAVIDALALKIEAIAASVERLVSMHSQPVEQAMIAQVHLLSDVLNRMATKERNAILRAAKHPKKFFAWMDEFYPKHLDTLAQALSPAVMAIQNVSASEARALAIAVCERSQADLLEASGSATESDFMAAIEGVMVEWSSRPVEEAKGFLERTIKEGAT